MLLQFKQAFLPVLLQFSSDHCLRRLLRMKLKFDD
jgi:hypothetical protein